jgi:formylglycine-generating enzyme required for sulfatase activity
MKHLLHLLGLLPFVAYALDAPVVGITATADLDSVYVNLLWNPIPGATGYNVFYQERLTDSPMLIDHSTTPSYLMSIPNDWTWYQQPDVLGFYSVVSIDNMILVPAGDFVMGQIGVTVPEQQVDLTNAYWLGETEVTNKQFIEVAQWAVDNEYAIVTDNLLIAYSEVLLDMSSTYCEIIYSNGLFALRMAPAAGDLGFPTYDPSYHPVKMVSWYGAACYCDWLSLMSGLPPYYQGLWDQIPSGRNPYEAEGYRLPTEAEWEYAAQFNDERTYPWGNNEPSCILSNCRRGCVGWTSPVGSFPSGATSLGLQDMAGNVWEWTNDWFADYSSTHQINPAGPASGSLRALRGGSWWDNVQHVTCAFRWGQSYAEFNLGFRICRTAL